MKPTSILRSVVIALAVVAITLPAAAQTPQPATPATQTVAQPAAPNQSEFDSRAVQGEFRELLNRHPENVGVLLKLDPSLFRNEAWMASYPALRDFVARHPEVAQNPSYFLESVRLPDEDAPVAPAARTANKLMEGIMTFSVMITIFFALGWLVRTVLEHRRWSRVSKVQTEIYNKLIDRFTSHEDLLRYVQSAAGKDFIQAAAAPPQAGIPSIAAPISRILWSVQLGVVLVVLGFGLQFVSGRVHPDMAGSIAILGTLALCAGLGFALSAVAAYFVSRKLGILPESSPAETELPVSRTLGE
jgi:hypothetical protein